MGSRYEEVKAYLSKNYFIPQDVKQIRELLNDNFPNKTDFEIKTVMLRTANDIKKIIED